MSNSFRIAFMGTPDFVVPTLQVLIDGPYDLVCIYTQPPREKGRHKKLEKTPVHLAAEKAGIEVRHPPHFKDPEDVLKFEELNLDLAVVAAFGMLLPKNILSAPQYGCINIHPSLLPRWRGPSPVQYTIWKGDKEAGVSVMSLEKAMDTGPILEQEKVSMGDRITFEELNLNVWQVGTKLLVKCLDDLSQTGALKPTIQSEEGVTYCKLFTKAQGRVNWSQSVQEIDNQIRALNPWPGTWCMDEKSRRIKILKAHPLDQKSDEKPGVLLDQGRISCGDGTVLQFDAIQPENKKSMDVNAALNGGYLKADDLIL